MNSHLSKLEDGQWTDVACVKRNLAVCQKVPEMSLAELQRMLLETRNKLEIVEENSERLQRDLQNVLENPVPVGYIYVELPRQPAPQILWPNVIWQDVTSSYAGLFFRAGGGNAASFNQTQAGNSPRLSQVRYSWTNNDTIPSTLVDVWADGYFSVPIRAGRDYGSAGQINYNQFEFKLSPGETRPMNTAVIIWKRVE